MEKETKIPTRQILSTLWIGLMFLYAYADIKCFFETGVIEKILAGNIDGIIITPPLLLGGAVLMSIPISMLILTLILPHRFCRILNIVIAVPHIPLAIAVLFVGTAWSYYYYYTALEITTLLLIIFYSLKWKLK